MQSPVRYPDAERRPIHGPQVLHFPEVRPDRHEICRLVHLQPDRGAHQRGLQLLDELLQMLPRLLRPRGVFQVDTIAAIGPHQIRLAGGTVFNGPDGGFLSGAELLATFVVTIGSAAERLARCWLRSGRVLPGTIVDAVASEAAEATAEQLWQEVRRWARQRGLEVTPRYSPGYCGLDVRQQIPLFDVLPAHRINVRLTSSCLMLPIKSISGLIGIGPPQRVQAHRYACEMCAHPDCPQRRVPFAGQKD